jgi:hypothetical protein
MKFTVVKSLVLIFLIFFFSPTASSQAASSDWQKINAEKLFTFSLPEGFTKTNMAGIEHYLGEYFKGKTRFLFIYGDTASNAYDVRREPEMENYQETETKIGGRHSNIRTFFQIRNKERIYRAELNIGDWKNANVELYMEVESKNQADLEMAKQIFNSVDFVK